MSLPPSDWTEEIPERAAQGDVAAVEWENPEKPGVGALLVTLRRVLLSPKRFFADLPLTGGLGEPLGFALLVGTTGVLSSFLWQLILEGGFSESMPAMLLSRQMGGFLNDPRFVVGVFLLTPLVIALGQFFLSICLWWAVRLTGPEDTTFEGAFRVAAYAQAPAVICLVPWGGALVATIWNLVVLVIGISKKFACSTFKALFTLTLAATFQGVLGLLFLLLTWVLGFWRFFFS